MNQFLLYFVGLAPSLAWLIFYLKEDVHPEPKKLIFTTFIIGALSTFAVLGLEMVFRNWADSQNIARYSIFCILSLAAIEEIAKFLAAYVVVSNNKKEFDEPIDAMIYMIVASLGFAAIENIAIISSSTNATLEAASLRFVGATLLHALSSGLFGYFWARSLLSRNVIKKTSFFVWGFISASVLHGLFNFLILKFEPFMIPTAFLIIYALFILYDFEKLKHPNLIS